MEKREETGEERIRSCGRSRMKDIEKIEKRVNMTWGENEGENNENNGWRGEGKKEKKKKEWRGWQKKEK